MLHHMLDDLKATSAVALRLTALVITCGFALLITTGFLCAALFVVVQEKYGVAQACLAGAAVFLVVTLITALVYVLYRRETQRQHVEEKSALAAALGDPATIAIALQIARTIGFKRLVPLLAIAGVALGLTAHRRREGADRMN